METILNTKFVKTILAIFFTRPTEKISLPLGRAAYIPYRQQTNRYDSPIVRPDLRNGGRPLTNYQFVF